MLDYEAVDSQLGKPGGADLQLGLTTGPALFAWEEHEAMGPLIVRKFAEDGDVEMVRRRYHLSICPSSPIYGRG